MAKNICLFIAGRISLFSMNWKAITQDTWVIQTVTEGYHIPFTSVPNQCSPPPTPHLSSEDIAVLEEETLSLLQKHCLSCRSRRFLNRHVKSEHFKMEGLHTVKALTKRDDFMAKVDLKDAFFIILIAPQFRRFFFTLKEKTY